MKIFLVFLLILIIVIYVINCILNSKETFDSSSQTVQINDNLSVKITGPQYKVGPDAQSPPTTLLRVYPDAATNYTYILYTNSGIDDRSQIYNITFSKPVTLLRNNWRFSDKNISSIFTVNYKDTSHQYLYGKNREVYPNRGPSFGYANQFKTTDGWNIPDKLENVKSIKWVPGGKDTGNWSFLIDDKTELPSTSSAASYSPESTSREPSKNEQSKQPEYSNIGQGICQLNNDDSVVLYPEGNHSNSDCSKLCSEYSSKTFTWGDKKLNCYGYSQSNGKGDNCKMHMSPPGSISNWNTTYVSGPSDANFTCYKNLQTKVNTDPKECDINYIIYDSESLENIGKNNTGNIGVISEPSTTILQKVSQGNYENQIEKLLEKMNIFEYIANIIPKSKTQNNDSNTSENIQTSTTVSGTASNFTSQNDKSNSSENIQTSTTVSGTA